MVGRDDGRPRGPTETEIGGRAIAGALADWGSKFRRA
jgi:hypothetical protein